MSFFKRLFGRGDAPKPEEKQAESPDAAADAQPSESPEDQAAAPAEDAAESIPAKPADEIPAEASPPADVPPVAETLTDALAGSGIPDNTLAQLRAEQIPESAPEPVPEAEPAAEALKDEPADELAEATPPADVPPVAETLTDALAGSGIPDNTLAQLRAEQIPEPEAEPAPEAETAPAEPNGDAAAEFIDTAFQTEPAAPAQPPADEEPVAEAIAEAVSAVPEPLAEAVPEFIPEPAPVPEPAPAPAAPEEPQKKEPKKGWFSRLKDGLSKSSGKMTSGIADIFTKRKLDDDSLDELEDLLIMADLGVETAGKIRTAFEKSARFGKDITPAEIRTALAESIVPMLEPVARPLEIDSANRPHVILMTGVNGSGKTTTIGKLALRFQQEGKSVMLAAGDTFRAAAIEQLQVWGKRTGVPVIAKDSGSDAASLAYEAIEAAQAAGADVLLIDTAGRLQNKADLMAELQKVVRVIGKKLEGAPHDCLLVLDATTGQNAISQVKTFKELVDVTGLIVTKLDGSARGGVVVGLADQFGLPVHAVGVGEAVEDLKPFAAADFAAGLVGDMDRT